MSHVILGSSTIVFPLVFSITIGKLEEENIKGGTNQFGTGR